MEDLGRIPTQLLKIITTGLASKSTSSSSISTSIISAKVDLWNELEESITKVLTNMVQSASLSLWKLSMDPAFITASLIKFSINLMNKYSSLVGRPSDFRLLNTFKTILIPLELKLRSLVK
ncbi:hypothetical protein WICPIJ_006541 [Wickerhamomyces pijperi]|uniref:Uncharacterized protein n=1 Tax=Wickerhamomyces pijperi TaxID=599730 RepID=A0A9P8Q1W6_WICPI|nr:hypothetical protein WICPIJ_006541 [Wickerhamomyces pijperi]